MELGVCFILAILIFSYTAPRQTGRWFAKVVIGYRAQMREEGEA